MKVYKGVNNLITGFGIDLEEISRFKRRPFDKNKSFYQKIFTKKEINYCLSKARAYEHFAVRFCAKEAFIKAWPEKIDNPLAIEVAMETRKPKIRTSVCKNEIHLSLSHTKNQAMAAVIILNNIC